MEKEEFFKLVENHYAPEIDHPWAKYPEYTVFRHANNQKWFALYMRITSDKLGLPGHESIDVVNLKCDPVMIGSFIGEAGVYPAYHMNKSNWVSVVLDGSASDETIRVLLDISYQLTALKIRKKTKQETKGM